MPENSAAAVIVSYDPDLDGLEKLVRSIATQVAAILIVDNGSAPDRSPASRSAIAEAAQIELLGENFGIARAHNIGIEWARRRGATHVLLLDHDSLPAPDMVARLLAAAATRPDAAALGPRYIDERRASQPPFIRVEGLRLQRLACTDAEAVIPVEYLISSGCLIPVHVIDAVGAMREDLFIDYVDIEWGLRARAEGFRSYGVCAALMHHSLGDTPHSFLGRSIPLHSPLRHYYLFRNAVLLYRSPVPPLNWKLVDGWRLLLKYGYYSLFASPRLAHWRMMSLGIRHGLRNRTGRKPE